MKELEIIALGNNIYNESDISPAQLGVTSRQINYWIDKAVVPFVEKQQPKEVENKKKDTLKTKKENKTKWIRLNLSQAVWVCIIKELLSFGASIEQLAELAESVWQKPRENKYADSVFKSHIKNNIHQISNENINQIKSYFN